MKTGTLVDAGNQSLDLNTASVPGTFNAIRIYASDLATAKSTLWSAIKNANGPGSLTPNDGIYDSGAAAHPGSGIGLARINDAHGDSQVQIRLTKVGDINLDGNVSIADFLQLAGNFGAIGTATWQEGDLNYDGNVSIADFLALASNFGSSYSGETSEFRIQNSDLQTLANFASSMGIDPAVIGSAVPEPGTLSRLALSGWGLMARRKRK